LDEPELEFELESEHPPATTSAHVGSTQVTSAPSHEGDVKRGVLTALSIPYLARSSRLLESVSSANRRSRPKRLLERLHWRRHQLVRERRRRRGHRRTTVHDGGRWRAFSTRGRRDERVLDRRRDRLTREDGKSDATGTITVFKSVAKAFALALDDGNIYWGTSDGFIGRMTVAGDDAITLASDQSNLGNIAVDSTSVYWSRQKTEDAGTGTIMRLWPK
jgi:hypothetical protein